MPKVRHLASIDGAVIENTSSVWNETTLRNWKVMKDRINPMRSAKQIVNDVLDKNTELSNAQRTTIKARYV